MFPIIYKFPFHSKILNSGTKTAEFEETLPVQPYLIAFVVSDFTFEEKNDENKVPQKLYARPAAILAKEGVYGINTGVEILTEQAKYFGVEYSLDKMDQISIPDFQAGYVYFPFT